MFTKPFSNFIDFTLLLRTLCAFRTGEIVCLVHQAIHSLFLYPYGQALGYVRTRGTRDSPSEVGYDYKSIGISGAPSDLPGSSHTSLRGSVYGGRALNS